MNTTVKILLGVGVGAALVAVYMATRKENEVVTEQPKAPTFARGGSGGGRNNAPRPFSIPASEAPEPQPATSTPPATTTNTIKTGTTQTIVRPAIKPIAPVSAQPSTTVAPSTVINRDNRS